MVMAEAMLSEFNNEMATTRRVLERVPADKLGWKPHEKSWAMAELATHLTNLPQWVGLAINHDSFDLAPPGAEPLRAKPANSHAEILERFDQAVSAARAALAKAGDEHMLKPWTLLRGGQALFTMPRRCAAQLCSESHHSSW